MAQPEDWDALFPAVGTTKPAGGGPVYGAPPKPEKQPEPKTTYRTLTPGEVTQRGLPAGTYQESSEGKVDKVGADAQPTEFQAKSAGFYGRMLRAEKQFNAVPEESRDARTYVGQRFHEWAPDLDNNFSTANRSIADNSALDFVRATLRLESGATISPDEEVKQYRIYFPMPGDGPDQLKVKEAARAQAIAGFRAAAGPEAAKIESSVQSPVVVSDSTPETPPAEEDGLTGSVSDDTPSPYDPGGPLNVNTINRVDGNSPGYQQIAAGVGDLVEGGLNNTVGLVVNPINTVAGRAMGYKGFTSDIGQTARDALGLPEGNQTISAINQAGAGGLSAGGIARQLGIKLGSAALSEYGSSPLMDMATGSGAAAGGEVGKRYGVVGQTIGTLAGGVAPTALTGGVRGMFMGGRPPDDFNPEVVAAGARQDVPIRKPDALPSSRGEMANLEVSRRGGPIIQQGRATDAARVEQRVSQLGGEGNALEPFPMGGKVQAAVERHGKRTGEQGGALYNRAEKLAGGVQIAPQNALQAVDAQIAELTANGANANRALISYLEDVKADLAKPGGLSIDAIRSQRTGMRGQIKTRNLDATDAERRVGIVMDAAGGDIAAALKDNPAALGAYRNADKFWKERADFRKQISAQLLGPKNNPIPAERAAERLMAMTRGKGDAARFERMWNEMEPEERADFTATLAHTLGRKANGDFSLSTLVSSLDPKKGVGTKAVRLIFGEEGARAFADLRLIAQEKTATANALNNSRTGGMVSRAAGGLKTILMTALGFHLGGIGGAVVGGVTRDVVAKWGEERAARALMNPKFTKWLRNAPVSDNPQVAENYWRKLELAAAKSPVFAGDVKAFQAAVHDAFAQSPVRAVAQTDQEKDGRVKPPQQR